MTNNYNGYRCWVCYGYLDDDAKSHPECETKMDKMYAISKMLEYKVITESEYKLMLSDINGGYHFYWNR